MARTNTYEATWTAATRKAYHAEHPENFAGPDGSFPIKDRSDVGDAWGLAGHADNPDAVRRKIIAIAKRLGFTDALPDTAKDFMQSDGKEDDEKKESTPSESVSIASAPSSSIRPRERIATIQVCWIEDNARSLNNRIYPAETVNRLIASGQRKLSDANALPITCFLSHADADNDHTPALIGRATKIWREGSKGMALIDLADTQPARDALGLLVGKYIRTESLRASNAELRTDSRYDVPVVGGDAIELDGIDLTNYPGLEACARVQQIQIAESANQKTTPLTEVFDITPSAVTLHEVYSQKDAPTMSKIQEADQGGNTVGGYTPTSGNTVGTTNDPTQDTYGKAMYNTPELTTGPMQGMTNAPELMEAHDRIAMVQNRSCAPGKESVRWKAAYSKMSESERQSLSEAGKKLSSKNDAHLDAAHDAIAKHTGMACEGVNNKMASNDPDGDGDDDSTNDPQKNPDFALDQLNKNNMESRKKGNSPMSKDDALRLLEEAGYDTSSLQKKKTEAELLREQLEALKAEQAKQLEEMRAMIAATQQKPAQQQVVEDAPQRRSLVNDAAHTASANPRSIRGQLYKHGQYLQEKIRNTDWEQLADRTCPLPENLELDHLIKEFEQLYAVQYDDRFKILSATELR
jgi:hypothetical protein